MRHRKAGVKLNRTASHRKAMFRNMVTSLFKYERIKTTDAKAKELRGWADHLITLAKRGDLHARRQALAIIREKAVVHKLFDEAPQKYGSVQGGYTRVIKLGRRPGDQALISVVELVTPEKPKKKKTAKKKAKPAAKKPAAAKKPKAAAKAKAAETPGAAGEADKTVETRQPDAAAADTAAEKTESVEEEAPAKKEKATDAKATDADPSDAADASAGQTPEEAKVEAKKAAKPKKAKKQAAKKADSDADEERGA